MIAFWMCLPFHIFGIFPMDDLIIYLICNVIIIAMYNCVLRQVINIQILYNFLGLCELIRDERLHLWVNRLFFIFCFGKFLCVLNSFVMFSTHLYILWYTAPSTSVRALEINNSSGNLGFETMLVVCVS